jgi:hypothetical protein
VQLVRDHPERAKELIDASRKTLGLFSEIVSHVLLPSGDRISRDWLIKTKNPYFDEIKYYADHLGVPGIYALNICFEWGCTSAVYAKEDGPTLTRVLDWMFPRISLSRIKTAVPEISITSHGQVSVACFTVWHPDDLRLP